MTAILVVDLKVKDADKLKEYGSQTPGILLAHNGRLLVKGPIQHLHGGSKFEIKVIFEFPTRQDALNWYMCEDYQALIKNRDEAIDSNFQLIGT